MRNFVLGCLLSTAALLLMNQQTTLVEAKPFLLLPRNFFVLTTRAPCTRDGQTNCSNSPPSSSVSTSSSTSTNFQIPNLITPKLQLLTTLLQGLNRGGSSKGSVSGVFGFGFKNFGIQGSATTTTTTSSPATTEPGAVFEPDSTESTATTTTSRTTSASSTSTTSTTSGPGYSYENRPTSSSSNKAPENGATSTTSTGTVNSQNGNNGNGDKGYSYESSQNNENGSVKVSGSIAVNNRDSFDTDTDENSSVTTSGGVSVNGGYNYGNDNEKSTSATTQRSGYRYGRPAENEVA